MGQAERKILILKFFEGIPILPTSRNCGAIFEYPAYKGVLSDKSYVEYCSADDAREAMKCLKERPLTIGSKTIKIKAALSKVNMARNWALRKAKEIKATSANTSDHTNTLM